MNAITFETVETVVKADHRLHFDLPDSLPVGCTLKITIEPAEPDELLERYRPQTEIGQRLLAARRAYFENAGKPLGWDEINDEVRHRRGGVADEPRIRR